MSNPRAITKAAVEVAKAEFEQAKAAWAQFKQVKKKKSGRPSVWKTKLGGKFVLAVMDYQKAKNCSAARAIGEVLRRPEFAALSRYGRATEVRYQETRRWMDSINPWSELRARIEMEMARERYGKALDRHTAALRAEMPPTFRNRE